MQYYDALSSSPRIKTFSHDSKNQLETVFLYLMAEMVILSLITETDFKICLFYLPVT